MSSSLELVVIGLSLLVFCHTALPGSDNCAINPTEKLSDSAATTIRLEEDTIAIGPKTTTGYVGENISANASIPLPDGCTGPIIFVNDYKLSSPCTNLTIYHGADGREHLTYTINGVQESVDGTRIDVCIFCGDHYECFAPANFYVKGRPNITNDDILIAITCNEVVITGSIDQDATLTIEIKNSSNVTIYKEDGLTLPHSINGSLLNPRDEYQLTAVATNKAGDSDPLTYELNFDVNMTANFSIESAAVKYVNDTVKVFLYISVNESCPLFKLDYLNVESSCLSGGHTLLYLNESFLFLLDLLVDQQQCIVVIGSKTTKKVIVDTSRIPNIRIWPRVTHNGYYSINATLLNGVTGVMVQVLYLNGTVFFNQSILRDSSHDYVIANSSTRLPNGTFNVSVYPLLSDGRSFDSNYTAMNFPVTCMMSDDPSDDPSDDTPTSKPEKNVPVGLIITVLICALILIVVITAAILLGVRARVRRVRERHQWTPSNEAGRTDDGGGDDGGGGRGGRGRVDEGGAVLRGINGDVDSEIDDVVANRSDNEKDNIGVRQVQVDHVEDGDNTSDESINTPTPSLHNGGHMEPATADKLEETATADNASAQSNLTKPMEAIEVGEGDGRPVISTSQSCGPPTAQDTTCSSEPHSWSTLLPQKDFPPKSTWGIFKKKTTHQGHDQPETPNEDLDQLQGNDFPLSEPIADTDCETKPNFVPGMVRQGSIQVDDAAASSQQVYVSPASSLNTRQLN